MAPSRKRKAAAAAAARRQWKVGDLVLAKLKGFPAWPATVSEPEKWGFQPDWKKVLVYFFGTQQIAFCNPADVEAFTEEKKQSLLKRQGRGADFVRAVKEIVDSFEKLKKQDEADVSNSSHEAALLGGGNSAESIAPVELNGAAETSEATVTGKSIVTTYTARRRSGSLRSRKQVNQKMEPVIDKSSITSCSESVKQLDQTFNNDSKCTGDIISDVMQNGCSKKKRRIRKSLDISEWDDPDSSAFVSSGSTEDNGSQIVPGDSDSCCITDSDCKLEHSEIAVESLNGDAELSKGLDFQIKAAVIKKKRNPSRKRLANEACELPAKLESEAELEGGVHEVAKNSHITCQESDERYSKDDGDEHLPLVKRARVRMGKLSSFQQHNSPCRSEDRMCKEVRADLQNQHNGSCQAEERTTKAETSRLEHTDASADLEEAPVAAVIAEVPEQNHSARIKEDQLLGSSADCEAALPPSKRLHRALEAMSANAAEEGDICGKIITTQTCVSGPVSSTGSPSHVLPESEKRDCHIEKDTDSGRALIHDSSFSITIEETKPPLELDICDQTMESFPDKQHCQEAMNHDDCKDINEHCSEDPGASSAVQADIEENMAPKVDGRLAIGSLDPITGEKLLQGSNRSGSNHCKVAKDEIPSTVEKLLQGNNRSGCNCKVSEDDGRLAIGSLDPSTGEKLLQGNNRSGNNHCKVSEDEIPSTGEKLLQGNNRSGCNCKVSEDEIPCRQFEASSFSAASPNLVSQIEEAPKGFHYTESSRSQVDDSLTDAKYKMPENIQHDQRPKEVCRVSAEEVDLPDKDVSAFQSSPFASDATESPRHTSPTNASQCHISTSESANDFHNSGCSSPSAQLQNKKSAGSIITDEEKIELVSSQSTKCAEKWEFDTEVRAALMSFEGVLRALTRTKESISRATRIAIDCAKLGVSSKVMEILLRTLETEPSLPKRVDLFFLVDSIAQCSRSLKGDVGGKYPSAIQLALPRLLSAAAPGSTAHENRRQCLKVLRLWLERRILPESVVRQHMRELDVFGPSSSAGPYARRSARTERSLDDPVRDMEGMLVDEYGSNASLQLAGFCMPRMLKDEDEGSDSDGGFEAVTPEHNSDFFEEEEAVPAQKKHTCVLEDVDMELEMEDVAPSCEVEINSTSGPASASTALGVHKSSQNIPPPCVPVPQEMPESSPPLPSSPPPLPPPLPPPPPHPRAGPTVCLNTNPCRTGGDLNPPLNIQNIQEDFRASLVQQSDRPRMQPSTSHGVQYNAPECRDRMQIQFCEPSSSSSSSYQVHHDYNFEHMGSPRLNNKSYHQMPSCPPPSNQFSYMQPGQYGKSRREKPHHPFSRRSWHNADGGHFYNNHERMRPSPYEFDQSWRNRMPHLHGPPYPDSPDEDRSFHPSAHGGRPREPVRYTHHEWAHPPRGMHNENFMHFRPSREAPSSWRPG